MTHSEWGDTAGEAGGVAPVIPLFGAKRHDDGTPSERHPAHGSRRRDAEAESEPAAPLLRALNTVTDNDDIIDDVDPARRREAAESALLKKLRAKALSESEARLLLRAEGASADDIEEIIEDCLRRGYLNDRTLAELLVEAGVQRRAQGRAALARSLSQRGLDRAVIDEVLGERPDDDAERALEYARGKARSLARLDFDTALRRLVGQLARRGFAGSVAMSAAKQALREVSSRGSSVGSPSHNVRFRDLD